MNDNGTHDFEDFLDQQPIYSKYRNNNTAKQIYELLSNIQNIHAMLIASDSGVPALAASITEIERLFAKQKDFDLTDDFTKQALGAMVKTILEPFGYTPVKRKVIPKDKSSQFITSAAVYSRTREPRLNLIQKLSIERV